MSGPPFRSGFTQLTSRLPAAPAVAATVGGSGLAGCSSASVTVTVIAWVAVISRVPEPLVASTVTSYELPVPWSCGSSKFGAAANDSTPVPAAIEKRAWSAPPVIA